MSFVRFTTSPLSDPGDIWIQFNTFIRSRLPRIKRSNGRIKTVQPNWASGYEQHTFLFEDAVIDLLKASKNQTKKTQLMRCGFNVVNWTLHLSTQRGMERRNYSQIIFEHRSIDEKSFKKCHHYVIILGRPISG